MLMTGCTLAPVDPVLRYTSQHSILPSNQASVIRIGVEYLPPDPRNTTTNSKRPDWYSPRPEQPRKDPKTSAQPNMVVSPRGSIHPHQPVESNLDFTNRQERWQLTQQSISAVQDPLERFALRFLSEMIGDDHKRVERAIGAPLLRSQIRLSSDPLSNFLDERDQMDQNRQLTKSGTRMVRRPLRNALREMPLLNDIETALNSFKSNPRTTNAPRARRQYGRVSLRVRGSDLENPLEVTWIKKGIRVSSSQDYAKASYATELRPDLRLQIRTRYDYGDYKLRLLGNLTYALGNGTSLRAMAGNLINVEAGLAPYPGGPQGDDHSTGAFVVIEHHF